jgi:ADP-ribose pyrophosphatase YjhB (NUDIX family)
LITGRQSNADRRTVAKLCSVSLEPVILERGAWALEDVAAIWREDPYDPSPAATAAADKAITELLERGSPAHDGVGARLVGHASTPGSLTLEIQPIRWAMRLNAHDAALSIAALCVTRAADGRWLAGRRAAWLSTWPGRWALGAGGAVDPGENPANTLVRELEEEWSVAPERIAARALVCLPHRLVMFVGLAWLPDGAEVVPDDEHDAHAWWPAAVDDWPAEADANLRRMAASLAD